MRLRVFVGLLLITGCASGSHYPARRCLYDDTRMERYLTGTAVTERADGAILFRFDDPAWGDKGLYWFEPIEPGGSVDRRGKILRPFTAAMGRGIGLAVADPWGNK